MTDSAPTPRRPRLPADPVGVRIAVRRRLADDRRSDTIGVVLEADDDGLLLRDRAGRRKRFEHGDLVAITVPPTGAGLTPVRRRRAIDAPTEELVEVQAAAWRATEEVSLGEWALRSTGGYTQRANSALAVGDPGMTLPGALTVVASHYAERDLPAGVLIVDPVDAGVDAAARAAGWLRGDQVVVMVADLADLAQPAGFESSEATGVTVDVDAAMTDEWREVLESRDGPLSAAAVDLLKRSDPGFAIARDRALGRVVGVARGTQGAGWLGLTAVEVTPGARRRGVAGALLGGLVAWALGGGARHAWLQVSADNHPARRVYAGAGFAEHHRYHYRWRP